MYLFVHLCQNTDIHTVELYYMKVSVIIPVYNVEDYLESCLQSVCAQTYSDYEVIVIDDCGQDASMAIVSSFVEHNPLMAQKLKVIHHDHNRGLSAARNTGIKASLADFVYFMDSDDTITPDCLEKLVARSSQDGRLVDMVVGNYAFDGTPIGCPRLNVGKPFLNGREYIRAYCKELVYPMAWNRLVRRDFILRHNLFFEEGLIHEDTLWNFQVLQYVKRVGLVEDYTYIYKVRPNSLQSSDNFMRHFQANSYIVGRLAEIMFGCSSLKFNMYVYDFVEQEKLRHMYDCYHSGNMQLVPELYSICRAKPHYSPMVAMLLFGVNKRIRTNIKKRDAHYGRPFDEGLSMFSNLPHTL